MKVEQHSTAMTKAHMIRATERAKARVQAWIDQAAQVQADTRKVDRLAALECKACFYSARIGGAAITSRRCMSCGSQESYSSTNTDALCAPCASAGDLCKHCGGDREMRSRRKAWPGAYGTGEQAC